jgi:heme-degrading monooxygenase HmoA
MIARSWTAQATRSGASAYVEFFEHTLAPELRRIAGYREALVLQRTVGDAQVEITVLTFWESMEAVAHFAGASMDMAVVELEARALLISFDEQVKHHEVALRA